ncbi:MAG TPA: hypothetical protein VF021_05760 [Longimicrobiales bacterium]
MLIQPLPQRGGHFGGDLVRCLIRGVLLRSLWDDGTPGNTRKVAKSWQKIWHGRVICLFFLAALRGR